MSDVSDWIRLTFFVGGVVGASIGFAGMVGDPLNYAKWPPKVFLAALVCIFIGMAR